MASLQSSGFKICKNYTYSETIAKEIKFGHIWIVKQFSKLRTSSGETITSSIFSATPESENKWYLVLYPGGRSRDKGFISVYLYHLSADNYSTVRAIIQISIGNEQRQKCNSMEVTAEFNTVTRSAGFSRYISRDDLMNETNGLLNNDELLLVCEAVVLLKPETISLIDRIVKSNILQANEDLSGLFNDKSHSDVVLIAESKELHAHIAVLTARSPIFTAMFNWDTQEKRERKIVIPDISYNVLENMLRFIYTGQVPPLDGETTMQLLYAADKYCLTDLKQLCERMLGRNIRSGNITELITLAKLHGSKYLMKQLVNYTRSYAAEYELDPWESIVTKHPELIAELLQNAKP